MALDLSQILDLLFLGGVVVVFGLILALLLDVNASKKRRRETRQQAYMARLRGD